MGRPAWILVCVLSAATVVAAAYENRHDILRLEQRWNRKSADEREVLRGRFEQLNRMDPETRKSLMERARKLRVVEEGLRENAPLEFREQLEVLDPQGRERHWREGARERFRQRGRDMRHRLPAPFLARLEAASPEERPEMLRKFRVDQIGQKGRWMFGYLARELELDEEEIEDYQELPLEEKLTTLRRMRREHIERTITTGEAPAGFSPERWDRLRKLSDRELFERLLSTDLPRLGKRRGHGERGEPGERGGRRGERHGKGRGERRGPRREL